MRKVLIVALLTVLPLIGQAQEIAEAKPTGYSLSNILILSAGAVAGVLLVDFLVGSALTVPTASVMTPAVQEASAAGAVFGDQVAAATAARDAKARADVVYAVLLGTGALLGGWIFNQLDFWTPPDPAAPAPLQ
jgi:hypothetical protein